jgi:hypothetical protein
MQTVSRFEANLLGLLYYFLGREPAERGLPLVEERVAEPTCLGRGAVRLVQDALAKGCVHLLATRGGWRRERFLRGGKAVEGRLWQRTTPADLGFRFTRHTLEFLIWVTAYRPGDREPRWQPSAKELTPADLLLLYFAHQGLREAADSVGAADLRRRPPLAQHGLCWLAYPEDYAAAPAAARPDFGPWTAGPGAAMLEALQPELEARWVAVEASKARVTDPAAMRALGQSQERVLTALLNAAEAAGRRDLARFLMRAAARVLGPHTHADMWVGALRLGGLRLADRAATYQAAAAFLRQLERLEAWERWARGVGYFDEEYAAAQLWKADWEQAQGGAVCERARAVVRQTDPVRQAGAAPPAAGPNSDPNPGGRPT